MRRGLLHRERVELHEEDVAGESNGMRVDGSVSRIVEILDL